jgi:Flp pilus assembly protein TadD
VNRRRVFRAYRLTRWAGMAVGLSVAGLAVSGCDTLKGAAGIDSPPSPTMQDAAEVKYYRSDEPLKLGLEYFERGDFGLAARYFQDAVTKAPKDATAWVALAATYDRIGRFDLADQAYASAIKLAGETVQVLNNEGYSYMLRGDLARARAKFLKARALEPANPIIINNLALLDSSSRFIRRAPEP